MDTSTLNGDLSEMTNDLIDFYFLEIGGLPNHQEACLTDLPLLLALTIIQVALEQLNS